MAVSVKELTAELKSLKKRLYAFQFKGLELQERARSHLIDHRLAELAERPDQQEVEDTDNSSVSASAIMSKAFGSTKTPLSNEYILEMVASYLPIQDLRCCRQVCKLWAKELRRCAHKRKSLVVAYEDDCADAEEILKEKRSGNYVNISTLVVLEIPLQSIIVQDLLSSFGNTMSGLKLDDCCPTAQEIYSALRCIPCLESFSVKTSLSRLRQNETSLLDQITSNTFEPRLKLSFLKKLVWEDVRPVTTFERLPELCPNLGFLKLYSIGTCRPERFEGLRWNSLQNLTLKAEEEFKSYHFEALSKLQLKLEKLKLYNIKPGGRKKIEKLSEFLESQRNTLVEITLSDLATYQSECDDTYVHDYTPFSSLSMPHLKNAKIDFGFINSLHVMDKLPALIKLDCKCRFWRNWWTILFKKSLPSPHPVVQEISLGAIDNECLQRIAVSFPNLTKLEISEDRIGDWALRTICRSFSRLNSLRIMKAHRDRTCPTITDSGVTGIPSEDCERLLISKEYEGEMANIRKYPFIGDLKDLRVLEVETSSDSNLSDVSIMCGISKLKSLVILSLPKCDISESAWKVIETLPNLYINEVGGTRKYFRNQDQESLSGIRNRSYKDLFADID